MKKKSLDNPKPKFYDIEQRSEDWHILRCGRMTSSKFVKLLSKETTEGYKDYIYGLAYELYTGLPVIENVSGYWVDRGIELEEDAVEAYEKATFNSVSNGGFYTKGQFVGSSPDGIVEAENGMIEIKCFKESKVIALINGEKVSKDVEWQILHQLWVSDAKWCDLVVYHPELPLFIKRYELDQAVSEQIEEVTGNAIEKIKSSAEAIKKLKESR